MKNLGPVFWQIIFCVAGNALTVCYLPPSLDSNSVQHHFEVTIHAVSKVSMLTIQTSFLFKFCTLQLYFIFMSFYHNCYIFQMWNFPLFLSTLSFSVVLPLWWIPPIYLVSCIICFPSPYSPAVKYFYISLHFIPLDGYLATAVNSKWWFLSISSLLMR